MKKFTLLCIGLIALFVSNKTIGQQAIQLSDSPTHLGEKPYDVEVVPGYVPLYVISDKKLPEYFVSGEIPSSFPKYDGKLKKGKNMKIAAEWYSVPENRALLTDDAQKHFDAKINELKSKMKK